MKSILKKFTSRRLALCSLLGLLATLVSPAHADVYSYKFVSFTNSVSGPFNNTNAVVLTNGVTLTVNSDPIPLRDEGGLAIVTSFIGTNAVAASTNVTFAFDLGIGNPAQGTNWTTTHPIVFAPTYNANTLTLAGTNYPASTLNNFAYIRLATITTSPAFTNTITVSNVWASYSTYAP